MNRIQEQVRDFHRACNLPRPDFLEVDWKEIQFRISLVVEELEEMEPALANRDLASVIDCYVDMMYFMIGSFVSLGLPFEPFWEEAHRANMEKVGGPKRADGKQLKPEGWVPPRMDTLLMQLGGYE
jgi:predicted HAD superfamily Cof-like phosphohydrolase